MTTEVRIPQTERVGEREVMHFASASQPGVVWTTGVEDEVCNCPGFRSHRKCWHVESVRCAYCDGYGTHVSYPRLVTCADCGGTGRAA